MDNEVRSNEMFREQYFQSVKKFVENLHEKIPLSNSSTVKDIVGYPLNLSSNTPKVLFKKEVLRNEDYILYKVQLESFLGIIVFGLMAEPIIKHKNNFFIYITNLFFYSIS